MHDVHSNSSGDDPGSPSLCQDPALGSLTADGEAGREAPEHGLGWCLLLQEALLPNPQTILKTAQDVFPHHMEKTGLGVAPVLADLTPTSDLEGLRVVGWLKPPLMWGRGPEKPVTTRANTAPFMWPTPAPLQWDEAAALERQWGQRVPDSTSSEEVQDQRHVSPHQWVDANHWGSKQR